MEYNKIEHYGIKCHRMEYYETECYEMKCLE